MAKKGDKGKKGKGSDAKAGPPDNRPRLSAHPRARRQIPQVRSWAGLIAFLLLVLLSKNAGVPWFDAVARGLLGGMVVYVTAWAIAVTVWRQIARAELEVAARRVIERRRELEEQAEAARAAAAARAGA